MSVFINAVPKLPLLRISSTQSDKVSLDVEVIGILSSGTSCANRCYYWLYSAARVGSTIDIELSSGTQIRIKFNAVTPISVYIIPNLKLCVTTGPVVLFNTNIKEKTVKALLLKLQCHVCGLFLHVMLCCRVTRIQDHDTEHIFSS